jgi:hypothetical protein
MKSPLRMNPTRYTVSKIVYVALLSVSVIVDASLAISLYEWLRILLGANLARWVLLASSLLLGTILYLLYLWQMEHITGYKEKQDVPHTSAQ